jgi:hypothetical protein
MASDHHDKITAKLIEASTWSIWKGDLNPSKKGPNQKDRVLAMEGKNLLELRNNFHNFSISIKNSIEFL